MVTLYPGCTRFSKNFHRNHKKNTSLTYSRSQCLRPTDRRREEGQTDVRTDLQTDKVYTPEYGGNGGTFSGISSV